MKTHEQAKPVGPAMRLRRVVAGLFSKVPDIGKNLARLVAATAIGQAISMLAAPILTRLYTPEEFGVLAVFSGLIGTLAPIATLRYESAIPLPQEDEGGRDVLALCIALAVNTGVLITVPLLIVRAGAVELSFLTPILPLWWFVPLGVVAIGIYQALSQWTVRTKNFAVLARTRVQQGVASVGTQVLFGLLRVGPIGLFTGQIVGQSAGIGALSRPLRSDGLRLTEFFNVRRLKHTAKRYRRFPLLSMPSAFLNSLALALPTFVLTAYYDSAVVGLYALTVRVAGIPMTILGQAVGNVYLGEIAELKRHTPERFRNFFYSSVKRMALFGSVGVGFPLLLARYVIPFIFGTEWTEAGLYLQLLAPMYAMQFVASPFGGTLAVLERQDLFMVREVSRIALTGGALWLGISMDKSTSWTIAAFGLAGFLGYVVYLYVARVAVEQWHQKGEGVP